MRNKEYKAFRSLQTRMLLRMVAIPVLAAAVIYNLEAIRRKGVVTRCVVSCFQTVLGLDYPEAAVLYQRTVNSHADFFILLGGLLVFAGLLWLHLRWVTGYFVQVSRGMDSVVGEEAGEISLPAELVSIERKMNAAKHAFQQQRSEMALTSQRKNDLVMYLAHDLKTPLASVISYLNLLRDEKEISEELREKYLATSLGKAERIEDLINEFLEVAKFNLSEITLQYSRINLTRLLEQLTFEFQPLFSEKGLTCRLTMAEDVMLDCDADKMQRVFDNLLRNAVTYSYPDTELTITARQEEEQLTLAFANRGSTIPAEKLERIFEQFYRLDTGRSSGGAGLGLAIARRIVTLHKGTITAQSAQERTTFLVTLPLS